MRIRDAHLSLEAIWEMLHGLSQSICPHWQVWYWQMKTILKCIQCLTFFTLPPPPPIPFFHYVRNMWRLKCIAMSVFLRVGKLKFFSWKALLQIRKETAYKANAWPISSTAFLKNTITLNNIKHLFSSSRVTSECHIVIWEEVLDSIGPRPLLQSEH